MKCCIGCGVELGEAPRKNRLRCTSDCGRSRGRKRKGGGHATREVLLSSRAFIGVDGEGVTDPDGTHRYILITVGPDSLPKAGATLATLDIFRFLYDQFLAHPVAAFVGFYLGYDFSQILRGLPVDRARMLLTPAGIAKRKRIKGAHMPPFPVYYEGWDFDKLGLGRFKPRPSNPPNAPWMTICDVGSFFQTSFLKAIDPKGPRNPVVTESEYALISEGKDGRSDHAFNETMIRYNVLECEVLSRLMAQLRDGRLHDGIKLGKAQWIGPGQASKAWFKTINLPRSSDIRERTSPLFRDAARQAYFGGWFEIFHHGPTDGPSYSYDINSAYPLRMSRLPCLVHGRYNNGHDINDYTPGSLPDPTTTLIRARVEGSHPVVGAMLHRPPKGKVLRPHATSGVFWLSEVEASCKAGFIDRI